MKTAKKLGLTIPSGVLAIANELIEWVSASGTKQTSRSR
jgi:hypothetical protein